MGLLQVDVSGYFHGDTRKMAMRDAAVFTLDDLVAEDAAMKRVRDYIGDEPFMLTYGDGVSDVDLRALEAFHRSHGRIATITTVNLGQMKGVLDIGDDNTVLSFREKDDNDGALINGGFMVMNPQIFDYLEGDATVFEQEPMRRLAAEGQMKAFYHGGFWQCMDTQREMKKLEELWQSGKAPWKIWKD